MCPAAAVVCNYICNKTVFAFVRIAVGIGTLLVALFVPFTGIMDVCNFFMFNFLVDCDGAMSDSPAFFSAEKAQMQHEIRFMFPANYGGLPGYAGTPMAATPHVRCEHLQRLRSHLS